MNTVIIPIGGKARHGKDETAKGLKRALEAKGKKVLVIHQADLLKHLAKTIFEWDGKKDEHGRNLLQRLGTEIFRAKDPNYWVDHLVRTLAVLDGAFDVVLVPDTRFPNEIEAFRAAGFHTIYVRVIRPNFVSPLTDEQQNHPSETALDDYPFDIGIVNAGGIADLYNDAAKIAEVIIRQKQEKGERQEDGN